MKHWKQKTKKKKIVLCILYILLGYLIYLLGGLTIPFIKSPSVSKEYQESFTTDSFYRDTIGVDRAAIIEESQEALDIRLHMLSQAKERIAVSTFSIKIDQSSQEFVSALLNAAERGVKVQMLVDGVSGWYDMKDDPIYYVLGTHPNVEIRYYNTFNPLKPWTFNGRLHDKFILIDDSMLLLGGRNISNYFLGEYNPKVLSYDRDIFVYNTVSQTIQTSESVISTVWDYFNETWTNEVSKTAFDFISMFKTGKVAVAKAKLISIYEDLLTNRSNLFENMDYVAFTLPTNKITLVNNPTHIMSKEPYIWYTLTQLMLNAKERVYVQTPYAVFSKAMYNDFTAINKAVPDFRMLTNSRAGGDNFMASSDYTINRKKVIKTGVDIYEFQGIHSLHNKSVLIDNDISVIGSFNFDMRSTYLDTEVMLVIHGTEFNQLLEQKIIKMQDVSLPVQPDGSYGTNGEVSALSLSTSQRILYPITSVIFQLFRYLL